MFQLRFLSGKAAGLQCEVRRFPFVVGRSPSAHCRLEEEGVWENHLQLSLSSERQCQIAVQPQAIAAVNGKLIENALLRNGDIISMGGSQILFLLGPTRQRSFRGREWATWFALALLCLGQVVLVSWLLS